MTASAASARPISLPRPDGVITRVASCGLSPKAMMLEVSRRTGHSTMRHSAAQSTQVTTAAMVSEIARKLPDTRRNECISGCSSKANSIAGSFPWAGALSFAIV